jgi:[ribosomal protein S5]-alanine N-acetyltransferase
MLPREMPVIIRQPIVLRPFRGQDIGLVRSAASDPLIPLISRQAAAWAMPARTSNDSMNASPAATGYRVASQFRRRSYGAAALAAISCRGLSVEGIYRIELYIEPWNQGSWRDAERAGYVREGLLRSWQRAGHELRDTYIYSLLPLPARGKAATIAGQEPAGQGVMPADVRCDDSR